MNRRSFIKTSVVALPLSTTLFGSLVAQAQEKTGWIEIPGTAGRVKLKNLFSIDRAQCQLFDVASGFEVSAHIHPAGEYSYMVEGTFESIEGVFSKGDYIYKEPGSIHPKAKAGPNGAIVFVFTPEPIVKI